MEHDSHVVVGSQIQTGVAYVLARMSFGRRVELVKRIRELAQRAEFLHAGKDPNEQIQGALLSAEIEQTYLAWGLKEIRGLTIDGMPATPELLIEAGPEELFHEAVGAVRAECGLTEAERKNS